MHSIRRQLLVWLLALVIVGVGFAGWLIYRQALAEANELFDYQLEQIAAALPSEPFSSVLQSRSDSDEGVVRWVRRNCQVAGVRNQCSISCCAQ